MNIQDIVENKDSGKQYKITSLAGLSPTRTVKIERLDDKKIYILSESTIASKYTVVSSAPSSTTPNSNVTENSKAQLDDYYGNRFKSQPTPAPVSQPKFPEEDGEAVLMFFGGKSSAVSAIIRKGLCPNCSKRGKSSEWNFARGGAKVCSAQCGWMD